MSLAYDLDKCADLLGRIEGATWAHDALHNAAKEADLLADRIAELERQLAEKDNGNKQLTSAYKESLEIAKLAQERADIAERHWPAYRKMERQLARTSQQLAEKDAEIERLSMQADCQYMHDQTGESFCTECGWTPN